MLKNSFRKLVGLQILTSLTLAILAGATDLNVKLKSGVEMRGKVVQRSDSFVWLETQYGEVALPVKSVSPESWEKLQSVKLSPRRGKMEPVKEPEPIKVKSGGNLPRAKSPTPPATPIEPKEDVENPAKEPAEKPVKEKPPGTKPDEGAPKKTPPPPPKKPEPKPFDIPEPSDPNQPIAIPEEFRAKPPVKAPGNAPTKVPAKKP